MQRSPESRLFTSFWDDGTLDLLAGAGVVVIGVSYLVEWHPVEAIVPPLALAAWMILRRWVVEPRAGYVEFSRQRRDRTGRALWGALALGAGLLVMTLAMLGMRGRVTGLAAFVDALPALLVALGAVVTAGLTRAWRFAVYGAVLAVGGGGTVLLRTGPGLPLLIGGILAGGTGAVLLARFLAGSRRFQEAE